MPVEGKVAVVTGASRGIGRAVALALAAKGADLLLVGRDEDALEAVAQEARSGGSAHVLTLSIDLATSEGLDAIIMTVMRQWGGFDILVNNAGIGKVRPITEVDDDEFDRTVAVNLRAPYLLTAAAVRVMRKRGGGQIVQIGSGLSYFGRAGWSLYAATKFALRGMTESVRHEVAREGIKVGLVAPGYTKTDFFGADGPPWDPEAGLDPDDVAAAVMSLIEQGPTSDIKELQVRHASNP